MRLAPPLRTDNGRGGIAAHRALGAGIIMAVQPGCHGSFALARSRRPLPGPCLFLLTVLMKNPGGGRPYTIMQREYEEGAKRPSEVSNHSPTALRWLPGPFLAVIAARGYPSPF